MPSIRQSLGRLEPASSDHPYLAFERLIPDNHIEGDGKRKHQVSALQRNIPERLKKAYTDGFTRRYEALQGFTGGVEGAVTRFYSLPVQGRLAAGLGNASVLENGLSLNHTYGLPYLPGTGLKGMASAMAHLGLEGDWQRGTESNGKWAGQGKSHEVLFGTMDTGAEDAAAGIVVFHDAWWDPTGQTQLPFQMDVMTPHHQKYNLEGGDWPNDWESPIPVPYVTCGGTFRLALTGPQEWVDAAFEILKMAFQHLGFGAKTQIGYGRGELEEHLSEEEQAEKALREAVRNKEEQRLNLERQKAEAARAAQLLAEQESNRLAALPLETLRGVLKPVRIGGSLVARLETGGVVFTLTQDELKTRAGDATPGLWTRLGEGREPKVQVVLVTDGTERKVIKLNLPS